MKRKMLMGLMSFALMGAVALPVSAQESTESKDTAITANIQSAYTLSIPEETKIAFEATSTDLEGTLKVTGNVHPSQEVREEARTNAFRNEEQGMERKFS